MAPTVLPARQLPPPAGGGWGGGWRRAAQPPHRLPQPPPGAAGVLPADPLAAARRRSCKRWAKIPSRCDAGLRAVWLKKSPPHPPFFSSLGRLFGRPRSPAEVTLRPRARRAGRAGGRKRRRKPVPAGRRGCSRSSSHVAFGGRVEFPPLPPRLSRHAGKSHVPVNHNAGQPPACHWSTDSEREIQLTCYVLQ